MREYKRYDEYKDSGIDYLKTIPKNWSKMKIKYIAKNNLESFIDGDWIESPYIQDEGIRLIQTGNIGNGRYIEKGDRYISEETFIKLGCTEIFPNDILICRLAEPVGRVCLAPQLNNRMITSVDVCRLTPKDKYLKKFIIYYMQMYKYLDYIESLARGSTRQRISRSQLGEVYITIPSKQEQQKIASFLDKKTDEIDEIINKKETLIDHLDKYKKSVITEAVTKGKFGDKYINEDGELFDEIAMKDSGVEWLGEIPNYWNIKRLKFVVDEINEKWDENSFYEYIGLENIESDGGKVTGTQSSENINSAIKFKKDDVLFNTLRPYLRKCIVAGFEGICTSEMLVLRGDDIFPQLLSHIMLSNKFIELVNSSTYGAKMPRANWDFIGNIYIPIVNKDIQKEIIGFLDFKISSIYNLINKTKQSIEKYKEYKKTLIFEAVTGKIDLRNHELKGGEKLAEHNNSSETERECLSAVD